MIVRLGRRDRDGFFRLVHEDGSRVVELPGGSGCDHLADPRHLQCDGKPHAGLKVAVVGLVPGNDPNCCEGVKTYVTKAV